MTIGTATHCKVLEGTKTFEASFIKKPESIKLSSKRGVNGKSKTRKRQFLPMTVNTGSGTVLWVVRTHKSSIGLTLSKRIIGNLRVSIYWDYDDIRCKARLDRVIVTEDEVLVVDLKTTDTVKVDKFQSKLVDLGYDFQAGWYASAAEAVYGKPARFVFVAVERNAPYTVDMFEVPDFMLEEAKLKNRAALEALKDCKASNYGLHLSLS